VEALSYKTTTNNFRKNGDEGVKKSRGGANEEEKEIDLRENKRNKYLKKNYSASQLLKLSREKEYKNSNEFQE
jgi:hypothetical protein